MIRLEIKNYNIILVEKQQYVIILLSIKIYKYEYLRGEEIPPLDQRRVTEQTKFTYCPLGKAFEKQIKTIEDQGEKQKST